MIVLRGYFAVHLVNPRDHNNVGCALRACGVFGAAYLSYAGRRYKRHPSDTQKAYRHMPLHHHGERGEELQVPYDCIPVAVEICAGATPLPQFHHPERALYVFGPEDGSIPAAVLDRCERRVVIPSDFCLNLAAAVNVVLYDRRAKRGIENQLYEHGEPLHAREGA